MSEFRHSPLPIDEAARVAALHELGVLDGPVDPDLQDVARLAAFVCGSAGAAVNLVDADRQWQAAAYGAGPQEVPRGDAMCAQSILDGDRIIYTPDASQEEVFAANPFVTGRLGSVRMYAAAPVVLDSGHVVGTLCVFDRQVRTLSREQLERLGDLASAAARILELRRRADTLARAATTDPLTGLRNRGFLFESLDRSLARWTRGERRPGVLYLDLDGFKAINDDHGHANGDTVLREVAARLRGNVREDDVVARLGGDEFVIVVEESPERLEARLDLVTDRLEGALAAPIELDDGRLVTPVASVGTSAAETDSETALDLLARADLAMYEAKAEARRRAAG